MLAKLSTSHWDSQRRTNLKDETVIAAIWIYAKFRTVELSIFILISANYDSVKFNKHPCLHIKIYFVGIIDLFNCLKKNARKIYSKKSF